MPNEVNIKVRVKDSAGNARPGLPVLLMNPGEDLFNPIPTVVVASGDTGADGYTLFTSVDAGTYAIQVSDVVNTGTLTMNNYEVKNSFVTNPDQAPFEHRFSVRSAESIGFGGILTQAKDVGITGSINFAGATPRRTVYDTIGPQVYQNDLGTIFTGTVSLAAKQSGNSYYHGNQNTTFTQFVDIAVDA